MKKTKYKFDQLDVGRGFKVSYLQEKTSTGLDVALNRARVAANYYSNKLNQVYEVVPQKSSILCKRVA